MHAWGGYRDHQHPHALMYIPLMVMSSPDEYRQHLDHLDLVCVIMSSYDDTIRHVRSIGSTFTLDGSDTILAG